MRGNGGYSRVFEISRTGRVRRQNSAKIQSFPRAKTGVRLSSGTGHSRRASNPLRKGSKDNAQLKSKDGGVLDEPSAIWPDNVLEQRLGVAPLVQLDAIVKL
jgi:hypothetical protein